MTQEWHQQDGRRAVSSTHPLTEIAIWTTIHGCKNIFTRAKDSRWEATAPGWNTEIWKEALKSIEETISHFPCHPLSDPRQCRVEEEEWSERPTLPQTPEPVLSSETRHHTSPGHRSIQVDSGYRPISAERQTPRNQAPGLPYRPRLQAKHRGPRYQARTQGPKHQGHTSEPRL